MEIFLPFVQGAFYTGFAFTSLSIYLFIGVLPCYSPRPGVGFGNFPGERRSCSGIAF